jgi:hypothetical protein
MNKYTQIVLTIIAVCLIGILIKLWDPTPAYSGFLHYGPTIGDLMDLRNLKDEARRKKSEKIIRKIPLVRIHGSVDVDVENTVDVSGSVDCY